MRLNFFRLGFFDSCLFQVIVVHHLRFLCAVSVGGVLCFVVYVESFPEYEFPRDFYSRFVVQSVDYHVWVYVDAFLR